MDACSLELRTPHPQLKKYAPGMSVDPHMLMTLKRGWNCWILRRTVTAQNPVTAERVRRASTVVHLSMQRPCAREWRQILIARSNHASLNLFLRMVRRRAGKDVVDRRTPHGIGTPLRDGLVLVA